MKKHSYYSDLKGNAVATYTTEEIFALIKGDKFKGKIDYCRYLVDKGKHKEYDIAKTELTAFTPNGVFNRARKSEEISKYSNLMVLDVDKLHPKKVNSIKEKAAGIKYTYAVVISPSGRGLKIFVQTDNNTENHKTTFASLVSYYQVVLGVDIDTSGSDLARLCFITHDPELYLNIKAAIFNDIGIGVDVVKLSQQYERIKGITEYSFDFDSKITLSEKELPQLAKNCNLYGLPKEVASSFMEKEFKIHSERVTDAINKAYSNILEFSTLPLLMNDVEQKLPSEKSKATQFQRTRDWLHKLFDLRYNEISKVTEIKEKGKNNWMSMDDFIENSLYTQYKMLGSRINKGDFDTMIKSDLAKRFNPFTDYFQSLKPWKEGDPDFIKQLSETVKTTKQEFWHKAFKKWLVAVVKGLLDEETYNETEIIFVGRQGAGKTTWLRKLLPVGFDQYYYEGIVDPHNKDHQLMLSTMWFINMDEMETMTRTQQGSLKQFITQKVINLRRAFGKNNEVWKRRASFFGSVNQEQFLNDPTGSRRFLCFKIVDIDFKHGIKIEDVYRQAYYLAQNNFKHYFSGQEIEEVTENNEDFQYRTLEEELLVKHFEPATANTIGAKHLNATSILTRLAELTKGMGSINTGHVANMGKILNKHEYTGCKHKGIYGYYIKELSEEEISKRETEPINNHKEFKVEIGEFVPEAETISTLEKIGQSEFEHEFGFHEGESISLWHMRMRDKVTIKGMTLQQWSDWYMKLEFGISTIHNKLSGNKEAGKKAELTQIRNVLQELIELAKEKLMEYETSFFAEPQSWDEEKEHFSFKEMSDIEKEILDIKQKIGSKDRLGAERQMEEYIDILEGEKALLTTATERIKECERKINYLQTLSGRSEGAFKEYYESRIDMHRWAIKRIMSMIGTVK